MGPELSRDPAELLESDHRELDELLNQVHAALAAADRGAVFKALDIFWARLAMHIRAEHLWLFPAVNSSPDMADTLTALRHDHDHFMTQLAKAIKALRLSYHFGNEVETLDIVRSVLSDVEDRLVKHNKVEELHVYTIVMAAENADDLYDRILGELTNYPPRFRRIES